MPLFDPAEHMPLTRSSWDERRARAAVDDIVSRTVEAFSAERFWPRNPRDDIGLPVETDLSLWIGAAGVLWALDRLGRGIGECGVYDALRRQPAFLGSRGLLMGETGVLLASWRLQPTREKEDRLFDLVAGNARNPEHELFNGSPGTMLAALHVYETTREERWRALWRECADALWKEFRQDPEHGCRIWIQYRRGRLIRSIGAGHGFASNVRSLLRGGSLLDRDRVAELQRAAAETAGTLALRANGLANWPTAADAYWAEQFSVRVQWCHGAPGLITSLWTLPRDEPIDELLDVAGELVWHAGPLLKGAGLCHGTSGNGCAFLALHARTGDERWLERAPRIRGPRA